MVKNVTVKEVQTTKCFFGGSICILASTVKKEAFKRHIIMQIVTETEMNFPTLGP